ncbi:beta-1,4-glucuronyltransferase 1 [Halyomorpha halys]|uniref:beta-1,4-glucuronyltransferase 1 n=1 Tax=Halyomorpha halys TaxID=286706 RepID=UPI0006D5187A|nr:beta-1,4-glucuronyltransferase 1-like [Halyomorpha halys]
MRCYLLAVRCLRTKCCLLLLIICIILIIGRVFHHKRAAFFRSILGRSSNDYDFFRPFFSNFSKNHQFVPGQFLNNYVPQNFSFCKFRFGLPYNLEYENDDVRYPPELREESDYRVVYNVLESSYPLNASTNVTYCTHATPEFVFYLVEILHRWQGPVSIATFVPSTDASLVICILNRLCRCLPDMSRVSLHFVFPQKYPPQLTDCPLSLVMPYDCSTPYAVLKKSIHTFRSSELLTYPVNVARNVARRQTMTTFVLVSDVELFPSKNLVKNFIKMVANLQKKSGVGLEECINKLVYVLPVFEVQHYEVIPDIKSKLLQLYGQSQAFYFHRWVCSHCQRFPGLQRWLLRKSLILDNKIEPFFVVRREFPFHRWEPVFIGTNADPLYSEMLSWEGQQDKMTQMHEMCLLRYRFVILDGAFLVHSPGVKRKADITKDSWRLEQQRLNNFHYDNIITSITARQKHNTRCKVH